MFFGFVLQLLGAFFLVYLIFFFLVIFGYFFYILILSNQTKGRLNESKCKLFPKGGGVDPKVYIFEKSIHSEKRQHNGFLEHKNVFW